MERDEDGVVVDGSSRSSEGLVGTLGGKSFSCSCRRLAGSDAWIKESKTAFFGSGSRFIMGLGCGCALDWKYLPERFILCVGLL